MSELSLGRGSVIPAVYPIFGDVSAAFPPGRYGKSTTELRQNTGGSPYTIEILASRSLAGYRATVFLPDVQIRWGIAAADLFSLNAS